jgi:hypothetical protein
MMEKPENIGGRRWALRRSICVEEERRRWSDENVVNLVCQPGLGEKLIPGRPKCARYEPGYRQDHEICERLSSRLQRDQKGSTLLKKL